MEAPPGRLAVVGLGAIAREVYLPVLRRLPGVEVVGLVDATRGRSGTRWPRPGSAPGADRAAGSGRAQGILLMVAGPGWPTRAGLALVAGYQRWCSPLLPGACRFWPTCSEYARLALLRHGLLWGGALALWRLCRCHRFARGGLDPPP